MEPQTEGARGPLRPLEGESAEDFERRGLAILQRKREKNAEWLKEVILEEQDAETARINHIAELDNLYEKKKSRTYREAKKSAMRLHEKQRAASRNKIEALIQETEVTLKKLSIKFQQHLQALQEQDSPQKESKTSST